MQLAFKFSFDQIVRNLNNIVSWHLFEKKFPMVPSLLAQGVKVGHRETKI
jgi:hypothetical protein